MNQRVLDRRNSLQDALRFSFSIYSPSDIEKLRPKLHKKLDQLVNEILAEMKKPSDGFPIQL